MSQIIAIAGGSCSGKTTLAKYMLEELGSQKAQIICQDSFYFDQSHRFDRDGGAVNFDHPESIDFELLKNNLQSLRSNRSVNLPIYDFATHKRLSSMDLREPTPVILVDGTLILSQEILLPLFDNSCFMKCCEDKRLQRRILRDTKERGRSEDGVREQFTKQVAPMHDEFVEPSQNQAQTVLSGEPIQGPEAFRTVAQELINKWNLK